MPMDRCPTQSPCSDLEVASQTQLNNDFGDKNNIEAMVAGLNLIVMRYAHAEPWISSVLHGLAQALTDIEKLKVDLSEREGVKLGNNRKGGRMLLHAKRIFVEGLVGSLEGLERDGDVNAFVVWAEELMQRIGELLVKGEGIT